MANINTTILVLLTTFLLIIFIYFSTNFHQNNFINTNNNNNNNNNNNSSFSPPSNSSHIAINLAHLPNFTHSYLSFAILRTANKQQEKIKNNANRLKNIEDGLARARSAIQKAIRTKNYTSVKQEMFVPRGRIYRNPYAFHQSHIEMEKRFKIWVYKEGDQPLVHQAPMKGIYGIEGMFIEEIENGLSKFLTHDPTRAHMFFLPISVTQIVSYFYSPVVSYERGPLYRVLLDYVNVIVKKHPYWNRTCGADHFMLSCHDWAPEISYTKPGFFNNFTRVLCNANTSEGFMPERDVSIPEVNIPADELRPPSIISRPSKRHIFAMFAGGTHGHVRAKLFAYWKNKDQEIQVNEYLPKDQNYYKLLGQSKYCLCPSGYEVASPRIVEAILAECVPVIIKDNYALPFNDVLDWSQFSVYIPVARIPEIKSILKGISNKKYARLLKGVRSVKGHFTLNLPSKPFDLIDMVLHSIWLRRLNVKLPY